MVFAAFSGRGRILINRSMLGLALAGMSWDSIRTQRRAVRAGRLAYWGVADARAAFERLISLGATARSDVQDVGEGIRVATVLDPFGNVFGIIENPHFALPSE